jgi:hypothetical protein
VSHQRHHVGSSTPWNRLAYAARILTSAISQSRGEFLTHKPHRQTPYRITQLDTATVIQAAEHAGDQQLP